MKRAMLALLIVYWIACIAVYSNLPERIPIHFGMDGNPNGWADRGPGWFGLPVLATVSMLFMQAIANLAHKSPMHWNVPEKKRFMALSHEQRAPIMNELVKMVQVTGLYTLLVMVVVQWEVYQSATGRSAGLGILFHLVLWPGMIGIIAYAFTLNRRVKNMILAAGEPE